MTNAAPEPGRPLIFRGGTVLTMNDQHEVLEDADVLVIDQSIAGVRRFLDRVWSSVERATTDGAP